MRLKKNSFGNDVYTVTFDKDSNKEDAPPLFGAKYDFHLEGVVDCPEFLIHFGALVAIAKKYHMKLTTTQKFSEFYKEQIKTSDGRGLIGRMQGLETYPPPEGDHLLGHPEKDYEEAEKKFKELKEKQQDEDSEIKKQVSLGTLSKPEWEACTLYMLFAFQKEEDAPMPSAYL